MTELKPVNPLVFEVLEGIFDGRLQHTQKEYHCGTSHCVAGWIELKYLTDTCGLNLQTAEDFEDQEDKILECTNSLTGDIYLSEWHLAQVIGNLTDDETNTLFDAYATIEEQKLAYQYLKEGNRILTNEELEKEGVYTVAGLNTNDLNYARFLKQNNFNFLVSEDLETYNI